MNILIISDASNPHVGGIENVSYRLGSEFKNLEHNVYYVFKRETTNGVLCTEVPIAKSQYYLPNSAVWDCVENREYLASLLRKLQINIILNQFPEAPHIFEFIYSSLLSVHDLHIKHVSAYHFNPYMKIQNVEDLILYKGGNSFLFMRESLGCNPILWVKSLSLWLLYATYRFDKLKKMEGLIHRYIYDKSDAFVLLSEKYEEPFKLFIGREVCDKLHSMTNSVSQPKEKVEIKDKEKIILYVGRLERTQKRVDRLLIIWERIYKDFPDWKLVIVGDGSYRRELEKMSHKHKLERVEFKGRQIPDEYYKKAAILSMVSTSEGLPLVLVEAQQAGCIPIAFNSFESVTDMITNGEDGFLLAPFDLDAYASKLSELMSNDDKRLSITNKCLTKDYSKFDIKNIAPRWIDFFETLNKTKLP